ncbi:tautomerase PptA [Photobacterium galatheae]|uniref:4-oxalocrotonate tautomerase n=1 Tax=Photobacterium galatheae TaxID=1654360 RepID=A0A066S102_9GAMM|nr:tautomerase PptA [Photobacterium galatheae]KDM93308.1 4-oxalocrotonate tautomerase [Photobacterium galatheae]MCM0150432.1 tautomerase PptA [Photobacterium galatheae]
MPHVSIKHFPVSISSEQKTMLVENINQAVTEALGCSKEVISISLESVQPDDWQQAVYQPEIDAKSQYLIKTPNY